MVYVHNAIRCILFKQIFIIRHKTEKHTRMCYVLYARNESKVKIAFLRVTELSLVILNFSGGG